MSHLLLLHSALGLRPAVHEFAEQLRARGHQVATPDYYDGNVFDSTDDGIGYRDQIGPSTLLKRVLPHLAQLPARAALGGFSLGAALAQHLTADRPDAAGAVLLHAVSAPRGPWPGVPVQVHRYATDPWIEEADLRAVEQAVRASGADFQDIVVPGIGHLFTDPDEPDSDPAATAASIEHIDAFLRAAD